MRLLDQLISVYPVDARELLTLQFDATTQILARQIQRSGAVPAHAHDESNRLLDTQDTMRAFADVTGGHAYTNATTPTVRSAMPPRTAPTTTC